jgi:ribose transport system substrate-binding protein
MTRTLGLVVLTLLLVAVLTGCGKPAGQVPGASPTATPGPGATPQMPGATGGLTIAVVPKGTAHIFWKTVQAGAQAAGKEVGAEILWNGPSEETDVTGQISIIEDFITRKVDALVMAACDAQALVPIVQKALKAGIPVITIDSGITSDDALCFVATDNVAGSKMGGDKLAELIGQKGKVGLMPFIKGAATSDMREEGFRKAIAAYPGIKIASTLYSQSDASVAMQKTEDMLTSVSDLAGIFAANEPAVVGAAQVIKQRNLAGKVRLVGFDASDAEIQALKDGVVQALIVQNPYAMGYQGVQLAVKAIHKETIDKRLDTGVLVVTKANLNDPKTQQWLNPLANPPTK